MTCLRNCSSGETRHDKQNRSGAKKDCQSRPWVNAVNQFTGEPCGCRPEIQKTSQGRIVPPATEDSGAARAVKSPNSFLTQHAEATSQSIAFSRQEPTPPTTASPSKGWSPFRPTYAGKASYSLKSHSIIMNIFMIFLKENEHSPPVPPG